MTYPIDAVIAVTYKCHSKCRMCSLWKIKEHRDVAPDVYKKLPETLKDVNISGGEPFLRNDLADIVRVVHERLPRARMVVSTNGFFGEVLVARALELVEIFPQIGFAFSVDGIGEKHDFIRGVKGGYEKILAIIRALKKEGVDNIRVAYTLTNENAEHMIKVYELAKELGVQYTMQVSHESDFFFGSHESTLIKGGNAQFGGEEIRNDFETIIKSELSSYDIKRWGRAFLFYGTYRLVVDGRGLFRSRPGTDYFFLDPQGDVYPSVIHDHVMGNLARREFDDIWQSKKSDEIRRKCREDKRTYWMGCMLRKALLDHKYRIGLWVLKSKFLGLKM
jgi:MoaA/NifB/PqqE/SkfB family radical SAM enzyme